MTELFPPVRRASGFSHHVYTYHPIIFYQLGEYDTPPYYTKMTLFHHHRPNPTTSKPLILGNARGWYYYLSICMIVGVVGMGKGETGERKYVFFVVV